MTFLPITLKRTVGKGFSNNPDDVLRIKNELSRANLYRPIGRAGFNGVFDAPLAEGIVRFQKKNALRPDGFIKPSGPTIRNLNYFLEGKTQSPSISPSDIKIRDEVGNSRTNDKKDVVKLKKAFNRIGLLPLERTTEPSPFIDLEIDTAIRAFQKHTKLKEDGFLRPDGPTLKALLRQVKAEDEKTPEPTAPQKQKEPEVPNKEKRCRRLNAMLQSIAIEIDKVTKRLLNANERATEAGKKLDQLQDQRLSPLPGIDEVYGLLKGAVTGAVRTRSLPGAVAGAGAAAPEAYKENRELSRLEREHAEAVAEFKKEDERLENLLKEQRGLLRQAENLDC